MIDNYEIGKFRCNEKDFELEIKSTDNRILEEQLKNKGGSPSSRFPPARASPFHVPPSPKRSPRGGPPITCKFLTV
ncbi:hypothetical protein Syun_027572 [Stephania yunnanensis]|uniref:Uncharacterized protein n=1 Tax=Stephania yunnanensis TaxID=152371 RepID=A0AAP0EFT6_9MAGN